MGCWQQSVAQAEGLLSASSGGDSTEIAVGGGIHEVCLRTWPFRQGQVLPAVAIFEMNCIFTVSGAKCLSTRFPCLLCNHARLRGCCCEIRVG